MVRLSVAICLAAAVSAVATPSSRGSSVTASFNPSAFTFLAEEDERNQLTVTQGGGQYILDFTDTVALNAGEGCVALDWNRAKCTGGSPANINLGDNDDAASVIVGGQTANVFAGKGNDHVFGDAYGGTPRLYGEEGDDFVKAAGHGFALADGGPGNDVVIAHSVCGGGGASGHGGPGDDRVYFTTCGNASGTDLDGGPGDDVIVAAPVNVFSGSAAGGDGNDIVRVEGGTFTITGGAGDDALHGGYGPDTVDGGEGNDYLVVAGGFVDVVTCGAGWDIVLYDASDTVSGDCEIRSENGHLAWFASAARGLPFASGLAWARAFPTGVSSRSSSARGTIPSLSRP